MVFEEKTNDFGNNEISPVKGPKRPRKSKFAPFDATWVANRFRKRKRLAGTRNTIDPVTGYVSPVGRHCFSAENKYIFIERFKICSNLNEIARSIPITIGSVYDAIAVDKKFRDDINACLLIPERSMSLNKSLESVKIVEKEQIVSELAEKAKKYS